MNLYRIDYLDDGSDNPYKIQWVATNVVANKVCRELKSQGMRSVGSAMVEVPTDKTSLMQFLNDYTKETT